MAVEVAANTTMNVTANRGALDPNTTATAAAFRIAYTPTYRQVLPGVDLDVPISYGSGIFGRSSAINSFPAGGVGDYEIGLAATLNQVWKATLQFTGYLGPSGPYLDQTQALSLQQSQIDRNFISFSLSRSF
jgi:hypothetical protein